MGVLHSSAVTLCQAKPFLHVLYCLPKMPPEIQQMSRGTALNTRYCVLPLTRLTISRYVIQVCLIQLVVPGCLENI